MDEGTAAFLRGAGVGLVSLGVQSFRTGALTLLGRRYGPREGERALSRLAAGGFATVNVDLMFALPGQSAADLREDLERAADLGADQITAYPLFTFPYSEVGRARRLAAVRLPALRQRREHYRALCDWAAARGFTRVSVWGFARQGAARYSSVTRDGYLGIGPGAGSLLSDAFLFNTFHLDQWTRAAAAHRPAWALHLPFTPAMAAWWWFYWRLYETRVPLDGLDAAMGDEAPRARRWLRALAALGWVHLRDGAAELSDAGSYWIHLAQNHVALDGVAAIWSRARREAWPREIAI